MPSLNADPMLSSLNHLAADLEGVEHERVQFAITARRAVLKRRRARTRRGLARFLPKTH